MVNILLAIIYLSFISLGLPDGLLGAAWPTMYGEFAVPVSYAGTISMISPFAQFTALEAAPNDCCRGWHGDESEAVATFGSDPNCRSQGSYGCFFLLLCVRADNGLMGE